MAYCVSRVGRCEGADEVGESGLWLTEVMHMCPCIDHERQCSENLLGAIRYTGDDVGRSCAVVTYEPVVGSIDHVRLIRK